MEEKKLDYNSIIGFVLIFAIMAWMYIQNQPTKEQIAAEKAKKAIEAKKATTPTAAAFTAPDVAKDSATNAAQIQKWQATLGNFAYSATLPSAKETFTTLENDVLTLKIANKGGYIAEAHLKKFEKFKKGSGQMVSLIKDNNSNLNLQIVTQDNKTLSTKDLFFEPTLTKIGSNQVLSMKLKTGANDYLEYQYVLKPNDYMLDFDIKSKGLNKTINASKPIDLQWDMKTFRNEKSVSYDNRYTEINYEYDGGKNNYTGQGHDKEETPEKVTYISFKQHFFSSILVSKTPFETSKLTSNDLVLDEKTDTIYTKQFKANLPLVVKNGEVDYKMNWYFGPTDYAVLKSYNQNLEKTISMGWGIIGWINKLIFTPLFGFLSGYMNYGIAIIIFTILIKLAMSPITYKSFLSQAKMKVLRPELTELNEKFAKDPMKKQQETMKLYNKAGVNPMAGCIPALIQMPFLMASFQFFPSAFELRQKSFLWADDLSSFDQIFKLPFTIPMYGDHVSLFPILAAIAIFFYMKMTSGDQQMAAPQQEGMPDMAKMMKMMIYISPLMMLIFFNSYGAGLSLYNFISNLITIAIMFVIKNYIVDSDKIHAQIQENKSKEPKKMGKFQQKLQEVMKQAEEQKAQQQKKK
ncbi:membrane protein insertase YidC [Flavobacterium branchiophilum]|uniref:Membrane protein insertase YidC n=1 Tax=Flavobacterium branchiophilum (strain FL-15) TaxID=1034807 RepID=G2Z0L6_FLABF|nr:membrane protein insertase YidC [Flavobacterium branchiophilum]CCB69416.1 Inner membrane protein OxaA [Flavobacterium branchiophilum FL-15]